MLMLPDLIGFSGRTLLSSQKKTVLRNAEPIDELTEERNRKPKELPPAGKQFQSA